MRLSLAVLLIACAVVGGAAFSAEAPTDEARPVWIVDLDGPVGPASVDLVIRSIDDADAADAQALIVRMDTPGGLDAAMRDLVKAILAADIPVITYVSPDGARAASAGTYIAYASHVAAMAPATNIGSSTPVSIGGPPTPTPGRSPFGPQDEGEAEQPQETPVDAMTKKVVNDAVAYLQSLAELRGRNIEWAEKTVREGANLRATDALEQNVIDFVATSLTDLLTQLDGHEVQVKNQTVTLRTASAYVQTVETDWRHELLSIITDPSIAYGLLIIGVYGLILEFYSPGMIFPAVTGAICILLGAYGLQMLPVNYAGFALIILGLGLMAAEIMTPTFGVLGVGGLISFVIGSTILFDSEVPGFSLPIGIIAGFAASTGAIFFFVVGAAVKARRQHVTTGRRAMIGAPGVVLEDFEKEGHVRAFGEVWAARSERPMAKDTMVTVTDVDGLTLTVEKQRG